MKGILALVLCVAIAGVVAGQQPSKDNMINKWDVRQSAVKNVQGQLSITTTRFPQKNPLLADNSFRAEYNSTNHARFAIDFEGGRFRFEYTADEYDFDTKLFAKRQCIDVFDGKELRSVCYPDNPGGTNVNPRGIHTADMAIISSGFREYPLNFLLVPVLFECGRFPNNTEQCFYPGSFHLTSIGGVSDMIIDSPRRVKERTDEIAYDLFPEKNSRQTSSTTIHVSPTLHFKPTLYQYLLNSKISRQYLLTYDSESNLLSYQFTANLAHKPIAYRRDMVVCKSFVYNQKFEDNDFRVLPSPGMIVGLVGSGDEQELKNKKKAQGLNRYKIGVDGSFEPLNTVQEKPFSWRFWLALAACIIVPLGFIVQRFRKKS